MPHENLLTWLPEHHAAEDLRMEPPQVESYQVNRYAFRAKEGAEATKGHAGIQIMALIAR